MTGTRPRGSGAGTGAGGALDEASLLRSTAAELDALFRAAPPGPVPQGRTEGTLLVLPGTPVAAPLAAAARLVAWQGKVFDGGRGELLNLVTPLRLRAVRARVAVEPSRLDGRPCVALDYSRTSLVARAVRDELREVAPGLHLGIVWLGTRRVGWFCLRSAGLRR